MDRRFLISLQFILFVVKQVIVGIHKREANKFWVSWKKDNQDLYRGLLVKCDLCGTNEFLGIHHLDGNRSNNVLANFSCLCWSCHKRVHREKLMVRYVPLVSEMVPIILPLSEEDIIAEKKKHYKWIKRKWIYFP